MKNSLRFIALILSAVVLLSGCEEILEMLGFGSAADLEVTSVTISSNGDRITIQVKNVGSETTSSQFTVDILLSSDEIIVKSDPSVYSTYRPLLTAGGNDTFSVEVSTLDLESIPAGEYFVGAFVDINEQVEDENRANNFARTF